MKRIISILLCAVICASLLVGCNQGGTPAETTEPAPTQTPEEQEILKILIVGNSHSGDTFWLLKEVFTDQYEGDVALGYLYYSGCSVTQHVQFGKSRDTVYSYHYNSDGQWQSYDSVDLQTALTNQPWDYVVIQPDGDDRLLENWNEAKRRELESIIAEYVPQPYKLICHTTWANPDDDMFYAEDWPYQKPPKGYKDNLIRRYGFDAEVQFEEVITDGLSYLVTDDAYEKKICTGTAIMHALWRQNRPIDEIHRDYTHLTDFGRLIASYTFFAQFTGQKITEVGIDTVPTSLRHKLFRQFGDLEITEEMKQVIIEAANYALDHPWEVMKKNAES